MSFEVKADGVDVERLLADVHNRIEERRQAGHYTGAARRFSAERALEIPLAARALRADRVSLVFHGVSLVLGILLGG